MPDNLSRRNGQHRESVGFLLIALLVLAIIAALAALGVWYWQQREVDRLNIRIGQMQDEQSIEINRLNDRIRQLENQPPVTVERQTTVPEPSPSNEFTSPKGVVVQVDTPQENAKISSPLTITGKVPGTWSFEASFPVLLKDGSGNIIAQGTARLQGEWMTTNLVPFEATLSFTSPGSGNGSLILQKDNPSGMPDKDDSVIIPIRF